MSHIVPAIPTQHGVLPEMPATHATIPSNKQITTDSLTDSSTECKPSAPRIDENTLGLLLDVEVNVLLRFGQRQLTLREVLDLTCGSVIELDRRVDEPVELLLDGRVIARGEAAIVDGHYGLRVTEIVQPAAAVASSLPELTEPGWRKP